MKTNIYIYLTFFILCFFSIAKIWEESRIDFDLYNTPLSAFFYNIVLILVFVYPISGLIKIIFRRFDFYKILFYSSLIILLRMIYLNVFIYSKTDILGYKIFYGLHKLNNIYFFVFLFLMILVTYLYKKNKKISSN